MSDEDRKRLARLFDKLDDIIDSLLDSIPEENRSTAIKREIKEFRLLMSEFENESEHDPYY